MHGDFKPQPQGRIDAGDAATGVGSGLEAGSEAHPLEEFASRLRAGRLRVGLAGGRQQDR